MILVDASVWIDFLRARPTPQALALRELGGREPIGVAELTLFELLRGERDSAAAAGALRRMLAVADAERITPEVAVQAGAFWRELRGRGVTSGTVDCLLATLCIVNGYALLFRDRDFQPFVDRFGLQPAVAA